MKKAQQLPKARLQLRPETIRLLSTRKLEHVVGGSSTPICNSEDETHCESCTST